MGKRYYCDFCEKSFADNPTNRRNHLKGVQHQRMRKAHYDAMRDAATILAEESGKNQCRKFFQRGECDFGENCRFSHLTPDRRKALELQVLKEKEGKKRPTKTDLGDPKLEDWLAKRVKKDPDAVTVEEETPTLPYFTLPPCLMGVPNLPPSLLPPPPDAFHGLPVEDWG